MLKFNDLDQLKKAFIFEVDDVLFPKKDYLLQVYYLFANLLEYTETVPPAEDLTSFFKKAYEANGEKEIFERASEAFGIDAKYKAHFNRIHVQAQLPLKLLMYDEVLTVIKQLHTAGKQLFILTKGNPLMQLNKLKHMEWHGYDKHFKVYFHDELILKGYAKPLDYLLEENSLNINDILTLGVG